MTGTFIWLEVLVCKLDRSAIRILSTPNPGPAVGSLPGRLALFVASSIVYHAIVLRTNHEVGLVRRMAACPCFI